MMSMRGKGIFVCPQYEPLVKFFFSSTVATVVAILNVDREFYLSTRKASTLGTGQ